MNAAEQPNVQKPLLAVADLIRGARAVVVITGAGVSAESGVPTFRGVGGLWRNFRPEELATPQAFRRDPGLVWEWYRWRQSVVAAANPNPAHAALAALERRIDDFWVLTQNVDGLHQCAGSQHVIELHGSLWRARCSVEASRVFDRGVAAEIDRGTDGGSPAARAPRCDCGALLRPDVVWFGESLDERTVDRATAAVRAADVLVAIGTSAVVYPVAAWPALAKRAGAAVVEINLDETPLSIEADYVLRGPAGHVLPQLERLL